MTFSSEDIPLHCQMINYKDDEHQTKYKQILTKIRGGKKHQSVGENEKMKKNEIFRCQTREIFVT